MSLDAAPRSPRITAAPSTAPILLLPVRLETRFAQGEAGPELWVRLYPDQIHVNRFDPSLDRKEMEHGSTYWTEVGKLQPGDDPIGPWRVLVAAHGAPRAAYIRLLTQPGLESSARATVRGETGPKPPTASLLPSSWEVSAHIRGGAVRTATTTQAAGGPALASSEQGLFPDPAAPHDPKGDPLDSAIRWMVDFQEAERIGMAVRVGLQPADLRDGIERVIAVGISASEPGQGAPALEQLIDAQHYTQGFAIVGQGSPTKNTPDSASTYARRDPGALRSFRVEVQGNLAADPRSDGQVLARGLGVGADHFQAIDQADGRGQENARLMAVALWPSTLGYFLSQMMADLLTDSEVDAARQFFVDHVRARGRLPAISVGAVPYGVLPVTSLSRWRQPAAAAVEGTVLSLIRKVQPAWSLGAAQTPRVGAGQDPDQALLGILGMEASSMDFQGRTVLGDEFLWNWLDFLGFNFGDLSGWWQPHTQASDRALAQLGLAGRDPVIRRAGFMDGFEIRLDTVAATLSETERLSGDATLPDGTAGNYLQWIARAAVDDLAQERWPGPGPAPTTLLYKTARASMLLEYVRAGVGLLVDAGVASSGLFKETILVGLGRLHPGGTAWAALDRSLPLTGGQTLKAYLPSAQAAANPQLEDLSAFKAGLDALAGLATAELDRLLTETLDACGTRLDAWASGLANAMLDRTRERSARGVLIGGYGYVEDLKPAAGARDSAGYIQAPSPQQAALAAVLRSGYLSHANSGSGDLVNLDISSDRVRRAVWYLDGVRQGQRLGALLGFHFEEGLHDRGLDAFVPAFRDAFPLTPPVTDPNPTQPASFVSAPNVVDGVALQDARARHRLDLGGAWGAGLPSTQADQSRTVEVLSELDDVMDAISNLSVAESVFQVMRGNSARAGGLLDAASRGDWAPEPEFLATPRSGIDISHRVLLVFSGDGAIGSHWPDPRTVRGTLEPRLDDWLARLLPDPATVSCRVQFTSGGNPTTAAVSLQDLAAGPLDVLAMARAGGQPGHGELEQRILHAADLPAGTADAAIVFANPGAGAISFPVLLTAAGALADLVLGARGLQPNDLAAPEAADPKQEDLFVTELLQRADGALAALVTVEASLKADLATLGHLLDPATAPPPARAALDAAATAVAADLLALLPYGFSGCVPLPRRRQDPTKPPGAAEIQALFEQGKAADGAAQKRIETAKVFRVASLATVQRAADVIAFFAKVVDGSVPAMPRFHPANGADLQFAFDPARALLPAADPDGVDRFLQQLTYVRPAAARLDAALAAGHLIQAQAYAPRRALGQLPRSPDPDRWIALEFTQPEQAPARGRLSILALMEPPAYQPAGLHSGLAIDDWPERIPQAQESSGLAFHYEEPKARAPQCLLLALAPDATREAWDADTLRDIVSETFEWAALRTVDIDSLEDFGQILPALYYGLNTSGTAAPDTVSTDFGGGGPS